MECSHENLFVNRSQSQVPSIMPQRISSGFNAAAMVVPYDEAEMDRASQKKFLHPSYTCSSSSSSSQNSATTTPMAPKEYDLVRNGKTSRRRLTSLTVEQRHPSCEDGELLEDDGSASHPTRRDCEKGYHTDSCVVIGSRPLRSGESNNSHMTRRSSPFCLTDQEPVVDTSESSEESYEEDALEKLLVKGTGLEQAEGAGAALSLYDRAVQQGRFEEALNVAFLQYKMGTLLWKNGSYEKSLNVLKRALHVFERHGGTRTRTMAEIYFAIGRTLASLSKRPKAHKYFQKALRTLEYDQFIEDKVRPEDQQLYAKILTQVASLLVDNGNYEIASGVLAEAITLQRQVLGAKHVDIAGTLLVYGSLNEALHQNEYAAKCFLEALDVYRNHNNRENNGSDHASQFSSVDVSVTLSNVGWLFYKTGHYDSALHSYEESLEIVIPILGESHRNVSSLRVQMGMCYAQQGNLNKALKTYRQALAGQRAVLGDNHEDVALTLSLVGAVYHEKKNYAKALDFAQHALTIRQTISGPNTVVVGTSYVQLGQSYTQVGEVTHAAQCFSNALTIYHTNKLPVTDPRVVEARQGMVALKDVETSSSSQVAGTTTEQCS